MWPKCLDEFKASEMVRAPPNKFTRTWPNFNLTIEVLITENQQLIQAFFAELADLKARDACANVKGQKS